MRYVVVGHLGVLVVNCFVEMSCEESRWGYKQSSSHARAFLFCSQPIKTKLHCEDLVEAFRDNSFFESI
jgi:hypothetical protein